ncbi:Signal peptidase complex subunit 1 [Trichinella pseudospiralis]|uniref:Signal peptidase complex subunit 1 n=1 Tax=Trichinella pseudospiralis TaxID=6337 RepID=A0A0V1IC25_TRIPS|nr:Signal peptidase complex subunit 1 [Trichinella pseudospiralis]KRY73402.1 Signal peptidase complex subunit 1 [Trichinella pseudospiralis]KRZ19991.1 Signal peptidase complex subunit 1 [Trichinella pseudospiralis]KRZ41826.1 Signal peptidase complex subunit 1 [Trichinella pseudospiralis]
MFSEMNFLPKIETHVDFVGQSLAEKIYWTVITLSAAAGFIFGYAFQMFSITVLSTLSGFALSCLLILPPWPYLRRHPIKWLKHQPAGGGSHKRKKN